MMPPARGRSITDFFKPRPPPPKRQRTGEDDVYDNIIVSTSQEDRAPKRSWPTSDQSIHEQSTFREGSTLLPTREPARAQDLVTPRPGDASYTGYSNTQPDRFLSSAALSAANTAGEPPALSSADIADPCASFMSSASLSSAQYLSQSTVSGSRRVLIGGIQGITASESEEEDIENPPHSFPLSNLGNSDTNNDDDDDDDDDLAKLAAIYTRPKPAEPQSSSVIGGHGLRRREMKTSASILGGSRRQAYDQSGKHSLASLLARQSEESAHDLELAIARSKLDIKATAEQKEEQSISRDTLSEKAFADLLKDDDDERNVAARLRGAMERTEVLQRDLAWHFFGPCKKKPILRSWPRLQLTGWLSLLHDQTQREHMFLSGFVAKVARVDSLPLQIISWLMDELWFEPKDDLRSAYLDVLIATPSTRLQTRELMDPHKFKRLLVLMGAKEPVQRLEEILVPYPEPAITVNSLPVSLPWLFTLITAISSENGAMDGGFQNRHWEYFVETLICISLDDNVQHNALLLNRLVYTIAELLRAIQNEGQKQTRLLKHLYFNVQHPFLQLRLLNTLPSICGPTSAFRRLLALAFFLNDPDVLSLEVQQQPRCLSYPESSKPVLDHLRSHPSFLISKRTDYLALRTSFSALDIAIDAGFSDFQFLTTLNTSDATAAKAAREAENKFNVDVSQLSAAIRAIEQQIHDAGASNMAQTMAKETARRLVSRLECATRTKEKRRTDMFASDDGDEERAVMQRWMFKTTTSVPTMAVGSSEHVK